MALRLSYFLLRYFGVLHMRGLRQPPDPCHYCLLSSLVYLVLHRVNSSRLYHGVSAGCGRPESTSVGAQLAPPYISFAS